MSTLTTRLLFYVVFVFGASLDILIRADHASRSLVNKYPNKRSFIKRNWITFFVRVFFYGTLLFLYWVSDPGALSKFLSTIGVPDWIATWATIPPSLGSSAMFGITVDYLLDWLQSYVASFTKTHPQFEFLTILLRRQLPNYDENVVDVETVNKLEKNSTDKKADVVEVPPPSVVPPVLEQREQLDNQRIK